jgi:hypothetical protein
MGACCSHEVEDKNIFGALKFLRKLFTRRLQSNKIYFDINMIKIKHKQSRALGRGGELLNLYKV